MQAIAPQSHSYEKGNQGVKTDHDSPNSRRGGNVFSYGDTTDNDRPTNRYGYKAIASAPPVPTRATVVSA